MKIFALLPLILLAGCGGSGGGERDDGKVRVVNADPASDPVDVLVDGVQRDSLDYGDALDLINGGSDFALALRTADETRTKNVKLTQETIESIVLTRKGFRTVHENSYSGSGDVRIRVLVAESDVNLDVVLTEGSESAEDAIDRWADVSHKGEPTSQKFASGTHRILAVDSGTDNVVAQSDTFDKSNGDLFVMVKEGSRKFFKRFKK